MFKTIKYSRVPKNQGEGLVIIDGGWEIFGKLIKRDWNKKGVENG